MPVQDLLDENVGVARVSSACLDGVNQNEVVAEGTNARRDSASDSRDTESISP